MQIAPRTYYAAKNRRPSARALRDAELKEEISRAYLENYGVYGARKVHAQLRREGIEVARCTVERLMRQLGLQGLRRGKRPRTTISDNQGPGVGDVVGRAARDAAPTWPWVADITDVRRFYRVR